MTTNARLAAATSLLRSHGADRIEHPGGTLLDHLLRVRRQLDEWFAPVDVQLAGLCHACYGTDGFAATLLGPSDRAELAAAIGTEAEKLAYLYGSCDRGATYPGLGQNVVHVRDRFTGQDVTPAKEAVRAFAEITAANELDVLTHNADFAERYGAALTTLINRMSNLLSADALRAWHNVNLRSSG